MQERHRRADQRRFPPDACSVRAARAFARQWLTDEDTDLAERVELVVSELAGNAVVHGEGQYVVRLVRDAHKARGEVRDGSRRLPHVRRRRPGPHAGPEPDVEPGGHGGRGLLIVAATADRWGTDVVVDADGTGKVVWFEIDCEPSRRFDRPAPG